MKQKIENIPINYSNDFEENKENKELQENQTEWYYTNHLDRQRSCDSKIPPMPPVICLRLRDLIRRYAIIRDNQIYDGPTREEGSQTIETDEGHYEHEYFSPICKPMSFSLVVITGVAVEGAFSYDRDVDCRPPKSHICIPEEADEYDHKINKMKKSAPHNKSYYRDASHHTGTEEVRLLNSRSSGSNRLSYFTVASWSWPPAADVTAPRAVPPRPQSITPRVSEVPSVVTSWGVPQETLSIFEDFCRSTVIRYWSGRVPHHCPRGIQEGMIETKAPLAQGYTRPMYTEDMSPNGKKIRSSSHENGMAGASCYPTECMHTRSVGGTLPSPKKYDDMTRIIFEDDGKEFRSINGNAMNYNDEFSGFRAIIPTAWWLHTDSRHLSPIAGEGVIKYNRGHFSFPADVVCEYQPSRATLGDINEAMICRIAGVYLTQTMVRDTIEGTYKKETCADINGNDETNKVICNTVIPPLLSHMVDYPLNCPTSDSSPSTAQCDVQPDLKTEILTPTTSSYLSLLASLQQLLLQTFKDIVRTVFEGPVAGLHLVTNGVGISDVRKSKPIMYPNRLLLLLLRTIAPSTPLPASVPRSDLSFPAVVPKVRFFMSATPGKNTRKPNNMYNIHTLSLVTVVVRDEAEKRLVSALIHSVIQPAIERLCGFGACREIAEMNSTANDFGHCDECVFRRSSSSFYGENIDSFKPLVNWDNIQNCTVDVVHGQVALCAYRIQVSNRVDTHYCIHSKCLTNNDSSELGNDVDMRNGFGGVDLLDDQRCMHFISSSSSCSTVRSDIKEQAVKEKKKDTIEECKGHKVSEGGDTSQHRNNNDENISDAGGDDEATHAMRRYHYTVPETKEVLNRLRPGLSEIGKRWSRSLGGHYQKSPLSHISPVPFQCHPSPSPKSIMGVKRQRWSKEGEEDTERIKTTPPFQKSRCGNTTTCSVTGQQYDVGEMEYKEELLWEAASALISTPSKPHNGVSTWKENRTHQERDNHYHISPCLTTHPKLVWLSEIAKKVVSLQMAANRPSSYSYNVANAPSPHCVLLLVSLRDIGCVSLEEEEVGSYSRTLGSLPLNSTVDSFIASVKRMFFPVVVDDTILRHGGWMADGGSQWIDRDRGDPKVKATSVAAGRRRTTAAVERWKSLGGVLLMPLEEIFGGFTCGNKVYDNSHYHQFTDSPSIDYSSYDNDGTVIRRMLTPFLHLKAAQLSNLTHSPELGRSSNGISDVRQYNTRQYDDLTSEEGYKMYNVNTTPLSLLAHMLFRNVSVSIPSTSFASYSSQYGSDDLQTSPDPLGIFLSCLLFLDTSIAFGKCADIVMDTLAANMCSFSDDSTKKVNVNEGVLSGISVKIEDKYALNDNSVNYHRHRFQSTGTLYRAKGSYSPVLPDDENIKGSDSSFEYGHTSHNAEYPYPNNHLCYPTQWKWNVQQAQWKKSLWLFSISSELEDRVFHALDALQLRKLMLSHYPNDGAEVRSRIKCSTTETKSFPTPSLLEHNALRQFPCWYSSIWNPSLVFGGRVFPIPVYIEQGNSCLPYLPIVHTLLDALDRQQQGMEEAPIAYGTYGGVSILPLSCCRPLCGFSLKCGIASSDPSLPTTHSRSSQRYLSLCHRTTIASTRSPVTPISSQVVMDKAFAQALFLCSTSPRQF